MRLITDTRKPSILDKLRGYYIEGRKLSDKQDFKRVQYEQAHNLRLLGMSKEQTVKMLFSRKIAGSMREAYRIVNCAEELYGEVNKASKEGLRHIVTENLQRIYNMAMERGDLKNANKAQETMAKINGMINHEQLPIDISKFIIPIPVYTSDPNVFKQQETIDISHEELEDEE